MSLKRFFFSWRFWKVFAFKHESEDGIFWEIEFYEFEKLVHKEIEWTRRNKEPKDLHKQLFEFFKRRNKS